MNITGDGGWFVCAGSVPVWLIPTVVSVFALVMAVMVSIMWVKNVFLGCKVDGHLFIL